MSVHLVPLRGFEMTFDTHDAVMTPRRRRCQSELPCSIVLTSKGVVHGGEFVFTKEATKAIGIDNLYAMMRNARGYADGGYTDKASMYGLSGGTTAVSVGVGDVSIINQKEQQPASNNGAEGAAMQKQLQSAIVDTINAQMNKNGSPLWRAVNGR